ncbi:MAG: 50S ribosomal protein L29 [Egibacteraceae bacterium]
MQAIQLRELDDAGLASQLAEAKEELFNLRFQLATGQLDNYALLGQARKGIARIKTEQRQRQLTGLREETA